MSSTQGDSQEIRSIVQSVVQPNVEPLIEPLSNEIKALRNDIKEIYGMIAELLAAAKQAGITLPRQ
jgi:uncharacterized protein (UPF0335 family)